MGLSRIGCRNPATVSPVATALEIARRMEDREVGSVVVVRDGRPVGIVTDRDIVLRVVLRGLDPSRTRADEFMTRSVVTADESMEIADAAARMRERHVRRLPVVGAHGELVGIVSLDDLFFHMSRAEGDLADVIAPFPVTAAGG